MEYITNKYFVSLQFRAKADPDDLDTYKVCSGKYSFLVTRKSEKWTCQCEESKKTLLPCAHETLVIFKSKSAFDAQLHRRWTNYDERLEEELRKKHDRRHKSKRVTLSEFLA